MDDMESTERRQLSWSDFAALMEQQRVLQNRIETLERQPMQSEDSVETEGLIQQRRLTESQVEAKEDEKYELPESAYTLLMTESPVS
eukprot:CAMPEP_0183737318 /NCGR_PEP_ID=MMETSP0737-20130205/51585_1 /TAXON_ID=385413 /ORGANISM="Thalassiosira miniscula, Strain CCMP1093" /LENGTH=86 /DNA_ID=CAMNT_0025971561 /DNA_START=36 /DNA_END=292 /DNA_ORIENTATION=+